MTARRRAVGLAAACALLGGLAALGGCTGPRPEPAAGTGELQRLVEAIDGVERAEVTYVDDFQQGVHHEAVVTTAPAADVVCVADRTLAVLHHAVAGTLIVTVSNGTATADPRAVGFASRVTTRPELDERYGPTGAETGEAPGEPSCDPVPPTR